MKNKKHINMLLGDLNESHAKYGMISENTLIVLANILSNEKEIDSNVILELAKVNARIIDDLGKICNDETVIRYQKQIRQLNETIILTVC